MNTATILAACASGRVKWRYANAFAMSGIIGTELGKAFADRRLLVIFECRCYASIVPPEASYVRLARDSSATLCPRLVPIWLNVGLATGLFGIRDDCAGRFYLCEDAPLSHEGFRLNNTRSSNHLGGASGGTFQKFTQYKNQVDH